MHLKARLLASKCFAYTYFKHDIRHFNYLHQLIQIKYNVIIN